MADSLSPPKSEHSSSGRARKQSASAEAMAAIFGGNVKDFEVPAIRASTPGRQSMNVNIGGHSRSPSSRLHRSSSPGMGLLNHNRTSPMHIMTDAADLSDLGDSQSDPRPHKPKSKSRRISNAEEVRQGSADSGGDTRVEKDRPAGVSADEEAVDSSDDEEEGRSSDDDDDDEEAGFDRKRGRRRRRTTKGSVGSEEAAGDSDEDPYSSAYGQNKVSRQAKSVLAAAEEERMAQSKAKLRLNELTLFNKGLGDEKFASKSGGVHPATSYDDAGYEMHSPDSSDADVSDIRRAQKLGINMSNLDTSVPNRVIRTIIRGDFHAMQDEAEEGLRRQRVYVVATDLSEEAVYALEWTIGTHLRDGDTMIAIYGIEDETATSKPLDASSVSSVPAVEGAAAVHDTMRAMDSQTAKINEGSKAPPSLLAPSSYLPATSTSSRAESTDSRKWSKPELERHRAIEDISATCVRLLRKTKLQVRVAVEVIHCKNPKHLIIEAADGIDPTMVIVGSRGRSKVKGVLLGSFSNYILTKSPVPTMVARKRLRKHAKSKRTSFRLSNNLQRPNRLTTAKID